MPTETRVRLSASAGGGIWLDAWRYDLEDESVSHVGKNA